MIQVTQARIDSIAAPEFIVEETGEPAYFHEESRGKFWVLNNFGEWKCLDKAMFRTWLKGIGFCSVRDPEAGQKISDLDRELLRCITEATVDYAGPMAGRPRGIHTWGNTSALVTKDPFYLEPVRGDWPTLRAFLADFLDTEKVNQWHYLMGWWQDALQAYYAGDGHAGLALTLAGSVNSGKSRLKDFIKFSMGGREAYAMDNLTKRDMFNRELAECAIWTIDDEAADTRPSERAKFGAEIKKATGNEGLRCRGMHKEGLTLEPIIRLIICVNSEPDKIVVLPELTDDVEDKMLILKSELSAWPMPMGTWDQKKAFVNTIKAEMPALVHYLLHEYTLPAEFVGERFMVRHFCHPDIAQELHAVSPENELADFIDRVLFDGAVYERGWSGSAGDLRHALMDSTNGLHDGERKRVPAMAWIGKRLSRLAGTYPDRFVRHRAASGNEWTIMPPENKDLGTTEE